MSYNIDKKAMRRELLDAFIGYQYRLDQPFQSPTESLLEIRIKYMDDPIFRTKVQSLVSGVMIIIDKYITMEI